MTVTPRTMFGAVEFWAQRTESPIDGREGWTVVDDAYVEHDRAGEYLRLLLDGEGRSVGTARTYAGRLALYLTWAASVGMDETSPRVQDLAVFARWLERTPSRKHRPGRNRRRAPDPNVVSLAPARSAATIDGILTAVVEFVRFLASRGWTEVTVATALSARHELRFLPPGFDRGERTERPVVNRRLVRRRRVERPPMTLTREEVVGLVDACRNARDRFVVEALYATGVRVAELCGLHLSDLRAMLETGEAITFAGLARRAGVSVSLLYADRDLAARVAEARDRQRQAGSDRAWRLPARSLVTEQSLRTDLANAKEQVRQLHEDAALLRQRLARTLGTEADIARGARYRAVARPAGGPGRRAGRRECPAARAGVGVGDRAPGGHG